jgi:hypothetical protein
MSNGMEEIIMTNAEKVVKIKELIAETGELPKELSEDELKQVVAGLTIPPGNTGKKQVPSGIMRQAYDAMNGWGDYPSEPFSGTIHDF